MKSLQGQLLVAAGQLSEPTFSQTVVLMLQHTDEGALGVVLNRPSEVLVAERRWSRSLWDALAPFSLGAGSYVNAMTEYEEHRVRAAYGEAKLERLAQIKGIYDPGNVFHRNINIKPA